MKHLESVALRWQLPPGHHRISGGGGGGGATLLTTLTLVNTSGSTQTTNFVAPMFGVAFKKGDVPSGAYPQFQLTGGTACPVTIFAQSAWSDGSMKRCSVLMRVPTTIAGSGTLTINVLNGGSAPASSSLSLSNVSARDIKAVLSGITNLTGTWTSSVNTGISNNTEVKVIANGPAGMVWRIRQPFNNGSTDHSFLTAYWYVAALQDASNGLWRIRFLPQIVNPYYNDTLGTKVKYGFTATLNDGATTLATLGPSTAFSMTATSGNALISATGHGLWDGQVVRLTGTPPTGFSTGTDYYARTNDANSLYLFASAAQAVNSGDGTGLITPTGNGTCTATPHLEVVQFASVYGAQSSGTWQSIQGGGSGTSECTVRIQLDTTARTYLRSTRLIPPYDVSQSTSTYTAYSYSPNGGGFSAGIASPLRSYEEQTGEDATIGVQPGWVAAHFLNQDANSEQTVRVGALSRGHANINLRDKTTGSLPVVNNTTYAGMPTATPTFSWNQSSSSGFTAPSDDLIGVCYCQGTGHYPSAVYYAALITGEPQFIDLMCMVANFAIMCRFTRSFTVSATTYYGVCFQDPDQARTDAWASRELGLCAGLLPSSYWEVGSVGTYINDCMKAGYDGMVAYNAAQSSFWTTNGVYHFRTDDCTGAPWQHSYLIEATSFVYAITEYSSALTFLNHIIKFPNAVAGDVGLYWYTSFTMNMRQTDSGGGALVTAMNQIYWSPGGGFSFSCSSSTNLTTLLPSNSEFTLSVGDQVMWFLSSQPPGATDFTPYFCRTVTDPGISSNKTFKIATTNSDGTIVTLTGSTSGEFIGIRAQVAFPTGGYGLDYQGSGYCGEARSAFFMANAAGATMPGTILADIQTIFNNGTNPFSTNAKLAMNTSY